MRSFIARPLPQRIAILSYSHLFFSTNTIREIEGYFIAHLRYATAKGADAFLFRTDLIQYSEIQFWLRYLVHHTSLPVLLGVTQVRYSKQVWGYHFKSNISWRRPFIATQLYGQSCHSVSELEQAVCSGADYVFFSPIFPTSSHPDALPVGLEKLAAFCTCSPIPVYALGGITNENEAVCLAAGAYGIAAISLFSPFQSL
jgi:hypothetical protein